MPCAASRVERAGWIASSEREIRAFVDAVGYPIIIKPVDGLGTRATFRVNGIAELDAVLSRIRIGPAHPVQVEEFLAGTEHSFETVSIHGKPVWSSSTDYIPGPLEVLETPWIQYGLCFGAQRLPARCRCRRCGVGHNGERCGGRIRSPRHADATGRVG